MSLGKSKQKSSSSSQQYVWDKQAPFLQSLYGMGQATAQQQWPVIGQAAGQLAGGLMAGAGPWANNATNPAIGNLMQRSQQSNPFLDQQISGLAADYGNMFRNQILPGIQSSAGLAGQFGGSRQGIEAGLAAGDIAGQFGRAATGLRSQAYQQGTAAAMGAGQLAGQGIGQMGDLYNLGMSPYMAQFAPLQALAGILGDPTVLGKSSGTSKGWGFNFGLPEK